MEQLDIWALIKSGDFEEACKLADDEYQQTKSIFPLRNKVYALFHLKKYNECIVLTEQLIKLSNGTASVDFISCGIANWLLDNQQEAVRLWLGAEKSIYKDAAGGMDILVFLYYASVKIDDGALKKDVLKKIKKLLKSKVASNWPGILGNFILDEILEEPLLSLVSNVSVLKERHLCQAYFTIATKALEGGDIDKYKSKLGNSIIYGASSYLEQMYYLSKGELEKMGNV